MEREPGWYRGPLIEMMEIGEEEGMAGWFEQILEGAEKLSYIVIHRSLFGRCIKGY